MKVYRIKTKFKFETPGHCIWSSAILAEGFKFFVFSSLKSLLVVNVDNNSLDRVYYKTKSYLSKACNGRTLFPTVLLSAKKSPATVNEFVLQNRTTFIETLWSCTYLNWTKENNFSTKRWLGHLYAQGNFVWRTTVSLVCILSFV